MEQILSFLTYADVLESGACLGGTIQACKDAGNIFFGTVDEMLQVFKGEEVRILKAAKLNGDGYGDGDGDGYGNGYGNGNGNGYGDGNGNGNGNGYGNGYGNGGI